MRFTSNIQSESECQKGLSLPELSLSQLSTSTSYDQTAQPNNEPDNEPCDESDYAPYEPEPELQSEFNSSFSMCNSKLEEYAALISMFFGANLTQSAFEIVVDLLNCSYQKDLPKRFDSIADKFLKESDVKIKSKKRYFCPKCVATLKKLAFSKQRQCSTCRTRLAMNYYFDMDDQLQRILSKNLVKFKQAAHLDLTSKPTVMSDVIDGEIYRNFLKTPEGRSVVNGNGLTFSINTDGCNPSDKSSISLWPVFVCINEIPIEERYCIDNVIIAGNKFMILNNFLLSSLIKKIFI